VCATSTGLQSRLNFVRWRITFMGPHLGTCRHPRFQDFWKICEPVRYLSVKFQTKGTAELHSTSQVLNGTVENNRTKNNVNWIFTFWTNCAYGTELSAFQKAFIKKKKKEAIYNVLCEATYKKYSCYFLFTSTGKQCLFKRLNVWCPTLKWDAT
jgi:hypothetical protein